MDVLGEYSKDVSMTVETFLSLERGGNPLAHAEISLNIHAEIKLNKCMLF